MQEKTKLNTVDRILLLALAFGVYAVLGTLWLQPTLTLAHDDGHTHYHQYAEEGHGHYDAEEGHSHAVNDIDRLRYAIESVVEDVVEDCRVVEDPAVRVTC